LEAAKPTKPCNVGKNAVNMGFSVPIVEWKGLFALHYFTKEIIDLKSELEEIEASPNMQQKKKEIQEKLIKI